ncbi:hypothetical protein [Pseudomonas syringae group genomosp. 3]|uniref:hypothetical protein n=1 Tax=Pseudomonas syringae group genomosp. 3 TaxID=251701 RepID=UPI000AD3E4A3|nr:hypothetical protein [Pseudomonas syringae group genomosp. 3]
MQRKVSDHCHRWTRHRRYAYERPAHRQVENRKRLRKTQAARLQTTMELHALGESRGLIQSGFL